ncbi:MAG TPA: hypothetical protein VNF68_11315 [Candidatus Baltobacteraceae bacterium]|nr:hypothetical protein [Candidatus Baltobacteraceae bacterium]
MIFLIVFSRKNGLQSVRDFPDSKLPEANAARESAIRENLANIGDIEIALFDAPDFATLRTTHRRYFETIQNMSDSFGKPA